MQRAPGSFLSPGTQPHGSWAKHRRVGLGNSLLSPGGWGEALAAPWGAPAAKAIGPFGASLPPPLTQHLHRAWGV